MKPIRLEMNAFLSYKGKEVVDFKLFDGKLFLIDGITGAGKTTIFDALCYALYGEATNSVRSSKSFKSDYADINTLSYVDLIFVQNNKEYHIRREPSQYVMSKRKNKDGNYDLKLTSENVLLEFDSKSYTKIKEVNELVKEILALDVNQFRQTMMIAQGKFSELVQADTSKRQELFREILGTESFKAFQIKISEMAKNARGVVEEASIKMNTYLNSFNAHRPESIKLLSADNPSSIDFNLLKENLSLDLADNEEDLKKRKEEANKLHTDLFTISNELENTKNNNSNVEKYNNHLNKYNELKNIESAYKEKENLIDIYKDSVNVLNFYEKYLKDKKSLDDIQKRIKENKENLNEYKAKFIDAEKEYKNISVIDNIILQLNEKKNNIIKAIKDFNNLGSTKGKLSNTRQNLESEYELYNKKNNSKNSDKETISRLASFIDSNKDIKVTLLRIQEEIKKTKDLINDLKKDNDNFKSLLVKKENLSIETKRLKSYEIDFINKKEEASNLEIKYLKDQAGILASDLKEGEECPVCGNKHHIKLGKILYHVTKEDVDKAKKLEDLANKNFNTAKQQFSVRENEFNNEMKNLISDVSEICKVDEENFLEIINEVIIDESKKLADLNDEYNKSSEIEKKYNQNIQLKTKLEKDVDAKDGELKKISDEITELKALEASLNTSLNTLKETTLGKDLDSLNKEKKEIEEKILFNEHNKQSITKKYNDSKSLFDSTNALIINDENILPGYKNNVDLSLGDYNKELDNSILKDIKKIQEFTLNHNKSEINSLEEDVSKFKIELTSAKSLYDEDVKNNYQNLKIKDSSSLESKLANAQDEYRKKNQLSIDSNTLYETNKSNLEQYIKINDKINEKAHEAFMLSRLSDVANGHVVGQERIDFETYYQSQVFGNILNVASKKLNIMTDGTYTMKRHIYNEQDGTKSTSLDVDIFDTSTGKTRSSKSLSGGETFMTALSLALGFAEVIRNEAGARELDCMFIDEGFGSLDNDSLHLVLNVLKNLSNQNSRMIGVISHVEELGYEINNKINVSKDANGSHLDIVCK